MGWLSKLKRRYRTEKPQRLLRQFRPQLEELESRVVLYSTSGNAWANPALITISFVPDGTLINGVASNLFATFNAKFGSAAIWENQILKGAQQWAQQTNINFAIVADSGAASGSGGYQQGDPTMGDIRIGGYNLGGSTLAQAYMPPPVNNYSIAGDMQFNTAQTYNIGSTYDLYTVSMHEIGHTLGLYHSLTSTAVMYATYSSAMTGLSADDISGIRAIYGASRVADSYGTSTSASTTAPTLTSGINATTKTDVVNNLDLTTSTSAEWFKFVVPAGSSTTLKAIAQSKGISLLDPYIQIYDSTLTLKASGNAAAYGGTATATLTGIAAGQTYYVKIYSTDSNAAFKTGNYALILNMGTGANPTPTYPNTLKLNGTPQTSGGGQALAYAPEVLVNTYTTGAQQSTSSGQKAVATDLAGNSVIVWASSGQDGSGWGVYAQRYNSSGVAVGGEFRVNTATSGDQLDPAVAMDSFGNFVVTWSFKGQDGSGWGIYAQRYDSNGAVVGGEFRVNTTTAGDQTHSSVAMAGGLGVSPARFVVTWTSAGQDGSGLGVYAQVYSTLGVAVGAEFRVNTTTTGDQSNAAVSMNRLTGGFVVTWQSNGQDGGGWGIYAQQYNLLGVAQGGEFRVNTTTAGDQTNPTVAVNRITGDFVIAWQSNGQDGSGSGIYAQRYKSARVAQGGEFRVNTTTVGDQTTPSVALDAGGNIFVTWQSYGQDGANSWGIFGQLFSSTGVAHDGEFRINTITAGDQINASVSISFNGQATVVFTGTDANGTGVYFRKFSLAADSFEIGTSPVGVATLRVADPFHPTDLLGANELAAHHPETVFVPGSSHDQNPAIFFLNGDSTPIVIASTGSHSQDAGRGSGTGVTDGGANRPLAEIAKSKSLLNQNESETQDQAEGPDWLSSYSIRLNAPTGKRGS